MQSTPLQGKPGRQAFLPVPSVLSPLVNACAPNMLPLRTDALPQSWTTQERISDGVWSRCSGSSPLRREHLKLGHKLCGSKPLILRGKWELDVPSWLYGTVLGVELMARMCLSLPHLLQWGYFLIYLMWRSHSASSWIFLRGNCSTCRAAVWGRKFTSLLYHHLGLSPY